MKKLLAAAFLVATLASCSAPLESAQQVPPQEPVEVAPEQPTGLVLPDGFPKVVPIEELPEQMRWAFEDDGTGQAVAVAEGVWAHLTPGATFEDAINAGVFEGYCASKEAFEREYLKGQPAPGMCW